MLIDGNKLSTEQKNEFEHQEDWTEFAPCSSFSPFFSDSSSEQLWVDTLKEEIHYVTLTNSYSDDQEESHTSAVVGVFGLSYFQWEGCNRWYKKAVTF